MRQTQISQKTPIYLHIPLYTLFYGQLERFSRAVLNVLNFCLSFTFRTQPLYKATGSIWLPSSYQVSIGMQAVWGIFLAFLTDCVP